MSEDKGKKLSRRQLLKGAAVGSVGVVAAGMAGCSPAPAASTPQDCPECPPAPECPESPECPPAPECPTAATPWIPEAWDYEADVVVIGYGFAGACAAIAAKQAGSEVLVLEKTATPEGGNSGCCSGTMHTHLDADPDEWVQMIKDHAWGTIPDEELMRKYVNDALQTKDWLEELGMELELSDRGASASRAAGKSGKLAWKNQRPGETTAAGMDVFAFEHNVVTEMGIEVMYATPALELVQDPATKEVLGVKAQTGVELVNWSRENPSCFAGGQEVFIKARKGVILACGGYEGNPEMQYNYNYPGLRLYPWGTPYNTGDGIKMGIGVGAALWHMHGLEWAAVNFKKATEQNEFSVGISATTAMTPDNHIFVNRYGKRFMNETKSMGHDISHKKVTDFNPGPEGFPNLPFFVIFDESVFQAGPICPPLGRTGTRTTYYSAHQKWQWSDDNSAELEAGWIFKADTLEELAAITKGTDFYGNEYTIDPEGLVETVRQYNENAAKGEDPEIGRDPERMAPIETGPFYAVELGLTCINTQGGPVRNKDYQVIALDGNPIPRLFSAGELGSINGFEYVCGNIVEAHTTGRVAGQNAAALEAWA